MYTIKAKQCTLAGSTDIGPFGPFTERDKAEDCVIELVKRPGVVLALIDDDKKPVSGPQ